MISYEKWRGWFAGAEPIGFRLRDLLPGRWVRFHNLPDDHRWPQTEADYATLLHRHNTVVENLLGLSGAIVLLTTETSLSKSPVGREASLEAFDPQAVLWRTVDMEQVDPGWISGYWHVYASEHTWQPGLLDPVIRLRANDEVANVLLLDPGYRWAISAYDGGMDIIMDSGAARDRVKARFAKWLPSASR